MKRKMQKFKKIAAVSAAAVMSASLAMPAFAAEGTTYTPVAGTKVSAEKYLVMDSDANVPNVTFNYTIAAGKAQNAANGNSGALKVFAGDDNANAVTGTPTVGTAVFKQGDVTNTEAQDVENTGIQNKGADGNTLKDAVTLKDGQKYARHAIDVDFSNVTFKEPGVYRYIITESASDTSKGITDDTDNSRVMDVYVEHDDTSNALKVAGYVLHNTGDEDAVAKDGSSATETKTNGWQNTYETEDLTIGKKVSGNQASHDEYFKFTVKISNAIAGTVYDVDLSNADATTKTNGINTTAQTNPATLTVGEDGTVTQDYYLQGGQSIKIQGLAKNTAYSVNEDSDTLKNEGYTASIADGDLQGDTKTGTEAGTDGDTAIALADNGIADTAITADTSATITNTKDGVIPTGVLNSVGPAVAVTGVAIAGITIAITSSKKRKKAEKA